MMTSAMRSNRRDDDAVVSLAARLVLPFAANADAALPRLVDLANLFLAVGDLAAGREVGTLDVLEQVLGLELAVVDERDRGLAHLTQVVGRDVGRHPDRDAGATVDEQVRDLRRQYDRLFCRAVVVGTEVDGSLLDLAQQLGGERGEPCFGVAIGGRRIPVDRTEIAVAVDQQLSHRERLRHADHRVVARRVAVGMELAEHVADDGRALAMFDVRVEVQDGIHRVEDAPLHRFEAVAHVG